MPHQQVIDGLEFARAEATLRGTWPIADLPRLRDALATDAGSLQYELRGGRDGQGRLALRLTVRGTLQLACQRCLGAMPFAVEIDRELALASSQAEIDSEPLEIAGSDWILAAKEMPLRDLLEDELLLEVPVAPRHAQCSAQAVERAPARRSPFSALRGLMRGKQ